ncbi:MAG: hypothetical protein RL698_3346 [Pseudomonadota bacterium]|jgi:MoaA/NifB/PqqE/SkfB family radical SAM enzyme
MNLHRLAELLRPSAHLTAVHFDIVKGCQLLCVGCPSASLKQTVRPLEPARFARMLANIDAREIDLFRLFNFGEPLLHPDLPGILEALARFRTTHPIGCVELSTNAQTVHWQSFERALAMRVIDRLVVSCDGDGTPESYEALRPPARWGKLMQFLERVSAWKTRHGDPALMTRTVVETAEDCRRWRSILEPLGWTPEFRAWKALSGAPENRTGRPIVPGRGVCTFLGKSQLYVDGSGAVVPCCAHPAAGDLGNLERDRWSTIRAGAARADFIRTLATARHELPVCSTCEYGPGHDPGPSAGSRSPEARPGPAHRS